MPPLGEDDASQDKLATDTDEALQAAQVAVDSAAASLSGATAALDSARQRKKAKTEVIELS
jgi:hypothetical protein